MNQNLVLFRMMEGQQINQYHLEKLLGAGGFGGVFLATEVVRDQAVRQLAVKIIPDSSDEQLSELITASTLEHDHLVRSYSAGECNILNTPMLYLAMELADGSLEAQLNQGKLSPETIRQVLQQTALGLKYLHQQKRVHRDLKPGNILLIKDRYKVSDFGLVRRLGAETYAKTVNPIGTIAYMPPEAFEGKIATAWDIWSLGIMAVQMITGKLPYEFEGTTQQLQLPSIPKEYEALVSGCLNPEWRDRWTVDEVVDYLSLINLSSSPVVSPLPPTIIKPSIQQTTSSNNNSPSLSPVKVIQTKPINSKPVKKNKLRKALTVIGGVLLLGLGVTQLYGYFRYGLFPSNSIVVLVDIFPNGLRLIPNKTLIGHSDNVVSVNYSPDGQFLASGSYDDTIKIWDAKTGREIRTIQGHYGFTNISYSPDGQFLASGSIIDDTDTIKIWDAKTGREIRTIQGHSSFTNTVSYSPDGKFLVSGDDDGNIEIWDAERGQRLYSFQGHSDDVKSVNYSPDGRFFASGSGDDTVKIWEVATGKELQTFTGHSSSVYSVNYSPDGRFLASGSQDNTIKIWEVATGKALQTFRGHFGVTFSSVDHSPNGRYLASASTSFLGGDIIIWDLATGKKLQTLRGHSDWIFSINYSPDGKFLASSSEDDTIKIWRVGE